ncbi:hypothetical protein R1sor_015249 [Riccia sorocarpa]|uniref:CCHC-type domain-containing protein n=1 Tax=Riccia sorocarpa TaxID=122646 RepID=A0ABD3HFK6_9MARC
MDVNRVPEDEMVRSFELAVTRELREHVKVLIAASGNNWEQFSRAMREQYFLEDAVRVTKRSFLEWVEQLDKRLPAPVLLREFNTRYSQLTSLRMERMILEDTKTELFLRAADPELQERLEMRLEDNEAEEGLTTNWRKVQDVVELLEKQDQRKEKGVIKRFVPTAVPVVPIAQVPVVPAVGLPARPLVPRKDDPSLEDIMKRMRDLSLKLTKLEEKGSGDATPKPAARPGWRQRCIWYDNPDHARRDCGEFSTMLGRGVIFWKDGKVALRDTGEFLATNFGKSGMKKLVEDYIAAHSVAAVEAACYGLSVQEVEDFTSEGYVKPSCLWKSALIAMKEEKKPIEARTNTAIRQETGWNDPVKTLAIHAYIAKSQHEAFVEGKRRRDDAEEGIYAKRQTRGDKARYDCPSKLAFDLPWGGVAVQDIKYQDIPNSCFKCQKPGHQARQCPLQFQDESVSTASHDSHRANNGSIPRNVATTVHPNTNTLEVHNGDFTMVPGRKSRTPATGHTGSSSKPSNQNPFSALANLDEEKQGSSRVSPAPIAFLIHREPGTSSSLAVVQSSIPDQKLREPGPSNEARLHHGEEGTHAYHVDTRRKPKGGLEVVPVDPDPGEVDTRIEHRGTDLAGRILNESEDWALGPTMYVDQQEEAEMISQSVILLRITEGESRLMDAVPTDEEIDNTIKTLKRGFIPGRRIDDNILTLRLAEEWSNLSGEENLFVKLDFTKAFDRVSYTFRWHTLRVMGLSEDSIRRIRGLMVGGSSRVHVNEAFSQPIKIKRGVRQGCPLAPLLFVLCNQPMIQALRKEESSGNLQGLQLPGHQSILHELFADDTSLFIRAQARNFLHARKVIKKFEVASGASLNMQKSMVMALGLHAIEPG